MRKGNIINSIFLRLGILELDLDPRYAEIKRIIKQIISGKSEGTYILYLFLMIWNHGQYG